MLPLATVRSPTRRDLRGYVKQAFLTGLAITVPILVTLLVLVFAFDFISSLLDPAVIVLEQSLDIGARTPAILVQALALVLLSAVIFLVGAVAESEHGRGGIERRFEAAVSSIPGVGSLYESINEISDLLLESDTESFQEVKLVEYPDEGSYSLAFVTAESPEAIGRATGHEEMVTLFMPMAPNPVMGGFVIHVSADRVYDVDMSVEDGIQAIVSSGVAVNAPESTGDAADTTDRWRDGSR